MLWQLQIKKESETRRGEGWTFMGEGDMHKVFSKIVVIFERKRECTI